MVEESGGTVAAGPPVDPWPVVWASEELPPQAATGPYEELGRPVLWLTSEEYHPVGGVAEELPAQTATGPYEEVGISLLRGPQRVVWQLPLGTSEERPAAAVLLALRVVDRSGGRYVLTGENGARYILTARSDGRYILEAAGGGRYLLEDLSHPRYGASHDD
jgi:hypothetical protein